jgi:hypothetical protein
MVGKIAKLVSNIQSTIYGDIFDVLGFLIVSIK